MKNENKILVSYQNKRNQKFISSLLMDVEERIIEENGSFSVDIVKNKELSRETIDKNNYSVILREIDDNKKIDFELLEDMNCQQFFTPVIGIGEITDRNIIRKLYKAGLEEFLEIENLTQEELVNTILKAIQKRKFIENYVRENIDKSDWHHPFEGRTQKVLSEFFGILEEELISLYDAVKTSLDSIILINSVEKIKEVNQATFDLLEIESTDEIIGKEITDFLTSADAARFQNNIEELRKDIQVKPEEYTIISDCDSKIPIEMSLSSVKDLEGNILGFVAICRDITDRKKAEYQREEHIYFLQQLINSIPNPVFYKDNEGLYLGCNKAFEEYLGLTREDIIGKTVYDISPDHLAKKYYKMDKELLDNGGVQHYEFNVKSADGTYKNVVFNKATFYNINGEIAGLVGIINDITEFKQMEKKLRQKEALSDFLLETAGHPIFINEKKEGHYFILDINDAAQQILGYPKEEIINKKFSDLISDEDKELFTTYENEIEQKKVSTFDVKFIDKKNKTISVKIIAHHLKYKESDIIIIIENLREKMKD